MKAGFKELTERRPEAADEFRKALREIGETKDRPKGADHAIEGADGPVTAPAVREACRTVLEAAHPHIPTALP